MNIWHIKSKNEYIFIYVAVAVVVVVVVVVFSIISHLELSRDLNIIT